MMDTKMFEQVRKFEDYISEKMEDNHDVDELIGISSGYAFAYISFFDEVKTDASDSMMLLKIYLNTLKKFERAIVMASIRNMVDCVLSEENENE